MFYAYLNSEMLFVQPEVYSSGYSSLTNGGARKIFVAREPSNCERVVRGAVHSTAHLNFSVE